MESNLVLEDIEVCELFSLDSSLERGSTAGGFVSSWASSNGSTGSSGSIRIEAQSEEVDDEEEEEEEEEVKEEEEKQEEVEKEKEEEGEEDDDLEEITCPEPSAVDPPPAPPRIFWATPQVAQKCWVGLQRRLQRGLQRLRKTKTAARSMGLDR
ncbi:uncharacterized protein LOC143827496 [Paroedura picta]|uniref:uncharacterized protein LOC143827496 n=1 Tax=Paroedura picta TaxID=143630 RepID=UPI004055E5D2